MDQRGFVNRAISANREKALSEFHAAIDDADCLILDGIQFFEGKIWCQSELQRSLDTARSAGKKMVLSSGVKTRELRFRRSLLDRLEGCWNTEIEQFDIDDKITILRRKMKDRSMVLAEDVLEHIAVQSQTVRALEGALNRLQAVSLTAGGQITLPSALQLLGMASKKPKATMKDAVSLVADCFGSRPAERRLKTNICSIVVPRQICM